MSNKMQFKGQNARDKMNKICALLRKEKMTLHQLEIAMLHSKNSLYPYITELRKRNRIHVASFIDNYYVRENGQKYVSRIGVYGVGHKPDAKRKSQIKQEKIAELSTDIKVVQHRAIDFPFPINKDPLMQAFYGL